MDLPIWGKALNYSSYVPSRVTVLPDGKTPEGPWTASTAKINHILPSGYNIMARDPRPNFPNSTPNIYIGVSLNCNTIPHTVE